MQMMELSHRCVEEAREREQQRQRRYYDRRYQGVSNRRASLDVQTAKGCQGVRLVHSWIGPLRIKDEAGYENFLLKREDVDEHSGRNEQFIAHVSFLAHYNQPSNLLDRATKDIVQELEDEDPRRTTSDEPTKRTVVRSTTTPVLAAVGAAGMKRRRTAKTSANAEWKPDEQLVELRRR
ncbi:LOW QUALITY PROTEIN: hypothetical protein PHMEG_0009461 [Phytophthora megakarya]|uniref:Uncharacterized protein n=1 Tax=Phytophthora megakarya TaxID=4795 RepID=A0A225WIM5_9STRA|nr:LOW QUALITY PROTEIN: hypothetical protein PHMEG_0009461 [Phytophthora megakarya]